MFVSKVTGLTNSPPNALPGAAAVCPKGPAPGLARAPNAGNSPELVVELDAAWPPNKAGAEPLDAAAAKSIGNEREFLEEGLSGWQICTWANLSTVLNK